MLNPIQQENLFATLIQPHVLMRPRVFPDGNEWCALYGDDLVIGVAGFGETPQKACWAFDDAWLSARADLARPGDDER
jgi:hypothetical protein